MLMYIILIAAAVILDVESNKNQIQDANYRQSALDENYLEKWKLDPRQRDYPASPGGDDNYEYPDYEYPSGKDGKAPGRDVDYSRGPAPDPSQSEKKITWPKTRENHVTRKGEAVHPFANSTLKLVENWPTPEKQLGQLSAVSIDTYGTVVVFHRGDRIWDSDTFLLNNSYTGKHRGPIKDNTIVGFDPVTGEVKFEWGNDIFYLPHGLSVDGENNVWVTDVALHQVMKFPQGGNGNKPALILGVPFIPGTGTNQFCKPTSVAVLSNGDFFVADGYCNNRILKYNKNAEFLIQWGRKTFFGQGILFPVPYAFSVPHSLALVKDESILCVADRENGRIQCFHPQNGSFAFQIHPPEFGSRLFAVASQGEFLYAINGPVAAYPGPVRGFKIDVETKSLIEEFRPNGNDFSNPHDIAVSQDGKDVYVVELLPFKVWKFSQGTQQGSLPRQDQPNLPSKMENASLSPFLKPSSSEPSNVNGTNIQATKIFAELKQERYFSYTTEIILVVVSVLLVCFIIISTVAFFKLQSKGHGISLCPRRWRAYGNSSSDSGFKLGQLLDPHSGFEKVCTEESDEDDEDDEEELVENLSVNLSSANHTVSHAQQA
ncbi:peptidyl-alpha-hydroxyglycine alpha-amidating lyase 1 [Ischnura elegans]|uniref:peptidyl-alpha-hydroxyglycine alpha-amidating lyase 1 n=1 Tax=Ischnura elegans TaxID=197161 RepID=UPI001ED8A3D6|nr:peptidyl-alpha-hydroxyglycine alpha-amidating lyase 1 [Ischnura elegans]